MWDSEAVRDPFPTDFSSIWDPLGTICGPFGSIFEVFLASLKHACKLQKAFPGVSAHGCRPSVLLVAFLYMSPNCLSLSCRLLHMVVDFPVIVTFFILVGSFKRCNALPVPCLDRFEGWRIHVGAFLSLRWSLGGSGSSFWLYGWLLGSSGEVFSSFYPS